MPKIQSLRSNTNTEYTATNFNMFSGVFDKNDSILYLGECRRNGLDRRIGDWQMNNKKLQELYKQEYSIQAEIYKITSNCKHKIVKRDEKSDCTIAICSECGTTFGWWCPKSPDHACFYFTEVVQEQLFIKLVDGTLLPYKQDNHDRQYETQDCCLFCGEPNERK